MGKALDAGTEYVPYAPVWDMLAEQADADLPLADPWSQQEEPWLIMAMAFILFRNSPAISNKP